MKKTTVMNTISTLPKEFSLDDLIEKLLVIDKIEEGMKDIKEGRVISHEKLKKEIKKWLK